MRFSSGVISDRLQAFSRALDSDPNGGGRLLIYEGQYPTNPGDVSGSVLLASCIFPKPCFDSVQGNVLVMLQPLATVVVATGLAGWCKFEAGGTFIGDGVVGLPGDTLSDVRLDNGSGTLQVYAGGNLTFSVAHLAEQ